MHFTGLCVFSLIVFVRTWLKEDTKCKNSHRPKQAAFHQPHENQFCSRRDKAGRNKEAEDDQRGSESLSSHDPADFLQTVLPRPTSATLRPFIFRL